MPFTQTTEKHDSKYWNDFYLTIKNEIELLGHICFRSETGPHNIVKNIIENLNTSDIVIAVLTDMNPNVWYELGIRHSLKNGTLMLIENSQKIPFDISSYGLIQYEDGISLSNTLKIEVKKYLNKLESSKCTDSPVIDFLNIPIARQKRIDETYELVPKLSNEIAVNTNDNSKSKNHYNRILWVDDYPSNNRVVIDFFENHGVRFDIALNTLQAMTLLKENEYDLIITDMGRGSREDEGLILLSKISKLDDKCNIPVVVFASKQATKKYGKDALELGAAATLNGSDQIKAFISKVLGYNI